MPAQRPLGPARLGGIAAAPAEPVRPARPAVAEDRLPLRARARPPPPRGTSPSPATRLRPRHVDHHGASCRRSDTGGAIVNAPDRRPACSDRTCARQLRVFLQLTPAAARTGGRAARRTGRATRTIMAHDGASRSAAAAATGRAKAALDAARRGARCSGGWGRPRACLAAAGPHSVIGARPGGRGHGRRPAEAQEPERNLQLSPAQRNADLRGHADAVQPARPRPVGGRRSSSSTTSTSSRASTRAASCPATAQAPEFKSMEDVANYLVDHPEFRAQVKRRPRGLGAVRDVRRRDRAALRGGRGRHRAAALCAAHPARLQDRDDAARQRGGGRLGAEHHGARDQLRRADGAGRGRRARLGPGGADALRRLGAHHVLHQVRGGLGPLRAEDARAKR